MKKLALFSLAALLVLSMEAFQGDQAGKKPKKAVKATKVEAPKVVLSDKAYDVKFDKTFHDFGKATEGDQVETIFVITNVGKEPVIIMSHEVQCGCTTPTYSKEPIMPGQSSNIKVGFNTNGKMGVNDKTVKITTNGGVHELKFKCEVVAKTAVDPVAPNGNTIKLKAK
ncbi:MAG: hypothetical protein RLZZ60_230 [Bacteroidota bacterium]|jgi:hypothetical protein